MQKEERKLHFFSSASRWSDDVVTEKIRRTAYHVRKEAWRDRGEALATSSSVFSTWKAGCGHVTPCTTLRPFWGRWRFVTDLTACAALFLSLGRVWVGIGATEICTAKRYHVLGLARWRPLPPVKGRGCIHPPSPSQVEA